MKAKKEAAVRAGAALSTRDAVARCASRLSYSLAPGTPSSYEGALQPSSQVGCGCWHISHACAGFLNTYGKARGLGLSGCRAWRANRCCLLHMARLPGFVLQAACHGMLTTSRLHLMFHNHTPAAHQ